MNIIKWRYLLQLTGSDDRGVAVLVVGQAKQDVVSNGPRHDPGSLGWEGDAAAVSDFTFWWHQLSQDHHEQGTLEQTEREKKEKVVSLYSVTFSFWAIKMLFSHRAPCNDSACFSALLDRMFVNGFCSACRFWRSLYKHSNQSFIFNRPTFPAPVDPATASIFPFSRYRLMFLRTGVT